MRIFVAGATGAMGDPLVKRLVVAGHQVTGLTRSESKRPPIARVADHPSAHGIARGARGLQHE